MGVELKICEKCGAPKETLVETRDADGRLMKMVRPIACLCMQKAESERDAAEKQRAFEQHMKTLQDKYGLSDGLYRDCTFERDDGSDQEVSGYCRRYVEQWDKMRANGMGILFYGPPGTGKSFHACSIANALLDRQVPSLVTNFPRLLNILQAARERQQYIDALRKYPLLVIDDLGVERESAYAAEQVYSVIDARSRSGLPLIVTTNMTIEELKHPATMQGGRIYDRILDMCPVRLKMTGPSHRAAREAERQQLARELLGASNR